jgi:hypothetical protein
MADSYREADMPKNTRRTPETYDKQRRALMQGATALTVLSVGGAAGCQVEQQKVAKATAGYQSMPNGPQACGNCANFISPSDCRVVQGPVAANGWSRYWQPRRA